MVLPTLTLPEPYRDFLRRVATETSDGWEVTRAGLNYAAQALERLGMYIEE